MNPIHVFVLRCGSCGHVASALDADRVKACMIDHLMAIHAVSDTERVNAE